MSDAKTKSGILVQNVMTRDSIRVVESETVDTALELMLANHVSALPVIDDQQCVIGIVSISDLIATVQDAPTKQVSSVMTHQPDVVKSDDSIETAANLLIKHQVHHLPVVNSSNQLVGIVSAIEFVRLTADGILVAKE